MGRFRNGTGLAGSETYSSNAASPRAGAVKPSPQPARRLIGVGLTGPPWVPPDGLVGPVDGLPAETLVRRVGRPDRVVARVRQDLAPEADLLEPALPAQLSGRSRPHVHVVVVEGAGPPPGLVRPGGVLLVDVG